jgi:hypothetical protein
MTVYEQHRKTREFVLMLWLFTMLIMLVNNYMIWVWLGYP